MDEYIGIVKLFAGNFAPKGWAFCNGQQMSIAQNTALFSILGTTYGGNGTTTFGLPNLSGRVAVGAGSGAGLPPVEAGQVAGSASVTLTAQQMPAHNHQLMVNSGNGTATDPTGGFVAVVNVPNSETGDPTPVTAFAPTSNGAASIQAISAAGGSQPLSVMQPYLGMNYIICLEGLYPSRG
jgi:microcystin-dependent protein